MYEEKYMLLAIEEARKALNKNEIPVGAVWLSDDSQIIVKNHNQTETLKDPFAHAEMLVMKEAVKRTGNIRIGGTMYITMIPCMMCAGAMLLSRIKRLYYGVENYKYGLKADVGELLEKGGHGHRIKIYGGYRTEEIEQMLKQVFGRNV